MKRIWSLFIVVVMMFAAFSVVSVNADDDSVNVAEIELTLEGGPNYIFAEWTEVENAVKYEFIVEDDYGYTKNEVTDKFFKWNPYSYYARVCVKAYDAFGNLIGESMQGVYRIDVIHADWWGPCGDADMSRSINIKDATYIQKYVAGMVSFSVVNEIAADADGNGSVDVKDATTIQKFLAGIYVENKIYTELWYGWTEYGIYEA